jgi:[ribosomal protein S5]-alanine N-acetyltransferase
LANELWGDPAVTALIGGPFTLEIVRTRLANEIAQMNQHGVQYWPVFLLSDARHVGCAGLRPYREETTVYEFGIHLRQSFWGKGLAAEAAHAVIGYAFGTLQAEALFAGHHPDNDLSRRLLTRLGFRYTQDEFYSPTRRMHPSYRLDRP